MGFQIFHSEAAAIQVPHPRFGFGLIFEIPFITFN